MNDIDYIVTNTDLRNLANVFLHILDGDAHLLKTHEINDAVGSANEILEEKDGQDSSEDK